MPLSIVVCQGWQNTVWNHHFLSFVPEFSEVQVRDLGIAWRAINNHKTCIPKSGSSTVDWGLANWPLANPSIPWWMGRWILHFQAQPYHKADCISHYVPFIPPLYPRCILIRIDGFNPFVGSSSQKSNVFLHLPGLFSKSESPTQAGWDLLIASPPARYFVGATVQSESFFLLGKLVKFTGNTITGGCLLPAFQNLSQNVFTGKLRPNSERPPDSVGKTRSYLIAPDYIMDYETHTWTV